MKALLLLLSLLLVSFQSSIQSNVIKTYYATFLSPIPDNDPTLSSPTETTMNQLLNTDDSPFVAVSLPFPVLLFNEYYQRLYINPNGAAHISKTQPCPLNDFSEVIYCTFNNSYYGVVAGFLADLQITSGCPGADIANFQGSDFFTIAFRRLCYFGTYIANSFRITFFTDSRIELSYDQISHTKGLPTPNFWISGLRLPLHDQTTFNPHVNQDAWGLNVSGIYPLPNQVISGNKFTICPISSVWCLKNSTLSFNHARNQVLQLATSHLSCQGLINMTLGYSLQNNPSSGNSINYLNCATNTTGNYLHCDINPLLDYLESMEQTFQEVEVFLWPGWTSTILLSTTDSPQFMNITALHLLIKNTTAFDPSNSSSSNNNRCYVNEKFATCQQNSCSFCEHDYTCLGNPCYISHYPASIYSDLACDNTCLEPFNSTSLLSSNVTDGFGRCCTEANLDCAGDCFGNNTLSLDIYGNSYCCPATLTVDCNNICGGTTVTDVCGICGGGDFIGYTCFNGSTVDLTSPDSNPVALYPQFNLTEKVFNISSYFYIVNTSDRDINATAWVSLIDSTNETTSSIEMQPIIYFFNHTLYNNNFFIPANSSAKIDFNISMERYVYDPEETWVLKNIVVAYNPVDLPLAVYVLTIPVYPQFTHCDVAIPANDMHGCMRYPGCMYCLGYSNMKLLKPNGHSTVEYHDPTNTYSITKHKEKNDDVIPIDGSHRRLFSNLIPNPYKRSNHHLLAGQCIDGYYQSVCDAFNQVREQGQLYSGGSSKRGKKDLYFALFLGIAVMMIFKLV